MPAIGNSAATASRRPVGANVPWVRKARYQWLAPHGLFSVAHCQATRSRESPASASTKVAVTVAAKIRTIVRYAPGLPLVGDRSGSCAAPDAAEPDWSIGRSHSARLA